MNERNAKYLYTTMAEVEKRGWTAVMDDILREANDGPENILSPSTSM